MRMHNPMAIRVAAVACLMAARCLRAATPTWTGGQDGSGTSWNDPANWGGALPGAGDAAAFTGTATSNKTVTLDAPQVIGWLYLNGVPTNLTIGSAADVSAGNTLTLDTVYRAGTPDKTQTIVANVAVAPNSAVTTWNMNGANGMLVVAGNISGAGKAFSKAGSGTLLLSGSDTFSSIAMGAGTLVLSGSNTFASMAVSAGTLVLGGRNTFSNIDLNGGTLVVSNTAALGSTGIFGFGGGTLQLADTTDLSSRFSQASNQFYNVVTPSNVTFATPLTSSGGSLSKSGAGKLTLGAANSYTGPTTLNNGTLTFSGGTLGSTTAPLTLAGGTLDLAGSTLAVGDVSIPGSTFVSNGTLNATSYTVGGITPYLYANLGGPGASMTKSGAGTLVMYGANTYTGDTTISNSTLQLNFTPSTSPLTNIISSASALKLVAGIASAYGKTTAGSLCSQTVNGLTVYAPGASALTIVNGIASGNTLVALGAITHQLGSTLSFALPTVNTVIGPTNGYVTTTTNVNGILGGWATVGNNWAANNGTNIVAYTGYTTLSGIGPTMPNDPTANLLLNTASTGDVGQVAGTNTINTLMASVSRTNTIGAGNALRLGAAGGILTTAGTLILGAPGNAGILTAGGADNTPGELVINNATAISNNAVVVDNGSGAVTLVKLGAGRLTMTSASTYSGGTFVNAGSLYLPGVANALATNSPLTILGGTYLDLGGGTMTNRAGMTFNGTVTVTNGTINLYGSSFNVQGGTIYASLGGSAGLLKTTSGTLTLTNANTYTGDTVVREGSLIAGNGSALKNTVNVYVGSPEGGLAASLAKTAGSSFNPFVSGKNYTVYGNGALNLGDYGPILSGTLTIIGGSINQYSYPQFTGSAAVKMTGGNFGGSVQPGSVDYDITSYATSVAAVVSASLLCVRTFTVADGTAPIDLRFTGTTGSRITKAGPGVMSSEAANAYSGFTLVSAGTLLVNNNLNYLSSGSGTGQGPVTNAVGATLGGIGFIGGVASYSNANVILSAAANTNSVSTLAPGSIDSVTGNHVIGTLTVGSAVQTNSVTFGKYARLYVRLGATPSICDCLAVNGSLNLGGSSNSNYLDIGTTVSVPKAGDYTVATFNVLTGQFVAVRSAPGAMLPLRYSVKYLGTPSGRGNELLNGSIVFSVPPAGSVILVR